MSALTTGPVLASSAPATRTLSDWLSDTYNVKAFGATGNGSADDTAAIQSAITAASNAGKGTVFFPPGYYKTTSTLTLSHSGISLAGSGVGVSIILPVGDFGNTLTVAPTGGATQLINVCVRNLQFYSNDETTTGAHIQLERVYNSNFSNLDLAAKYGQLRLTSAVHCSFTNINLQSDASFTSYRAGSYLLLVDKHASGAIPAELHFVNCDWRGQNGNNYLDYGVLVTCCDGLFISNAHIGFCKTAAVALLPATNNSQITAIDISNCYLDTVTGGYGLWTNEPSSSYVSQLGYCSLRGCQVYNCLIGVVWCAGGRETESNIDGTQFLHIGNHAVQIQKCNGLTISNCRVTDINTTATTGYGIDIIAAANNVSIDGLSVRKGVYAAPSAAVHVESGTTNLKIKNIETEGCAADIINASSSGSIVAYDVIRDDGIITVSADGSNILNVPLGPELFSLGTLNNVSSINAVSSQKWRKVTLVATGNVTVNSANNLKLASNFSMTSNDSLSLICDGTNWLELSRSVNAP